MSDFNWDDHPIADDAGPKPASAGFSWDSHPVVGKHMSETESAIRGGIQGLPLVGPWADEAQGAAEALWSKAKGDPKEFGELYKEHRDAAREKYKTAAEVNPKSYYGGLGASVVASALPKAIPVLGPLASGAMGSIEGAGASESEDPEQIAKDAAAMGALSAGTAGLGRLAVPAVGKFVGKIGEKLGDTAESLSARAMGAMKGNTKKLTPEEVRKIGAYGLENKIVTPLASGEEMATRNAAVKAAGGQKMGQVYDAIDNAGVSSFNPSAVADKINEELAPMYRTPLNKSEWSQFDNMIEAVKHRGSDPIAMKEAQALKNEFSAVAYPGGKKAIDPSPKQQMAMQALGIINKEIDAATERGAQAIGKPELAEALSQGKQLYGGGSKAEKFLRDKTSSERSKVFGLTDWIGAAGSMGAAAATHGESVPLTVAAMGAKKLAEKYGSGTAAVGLNKLSQLLTDSPETLGKFGPVLEKAAQRGVEALNVTHQMLMKDPEYQKIVGQ